MKSLIHLSAALLPLVSGRSLFARQATETISKFGIIALHSTSPIHLSSVNAAQGKFWIGKDTSTYCPAIDGLACPPGDMTVFASASGQDRLGLDTEVPGGQSVYVGPNGALGFTQAHSAFAPEGSSFVGFNATVPEDSTTLGHVAYNGTEGFVACPTNGTQGPYQVFLDLGELSDGDVPAGCVAECIGFRAAAYRYTEEGPAAWQYA